MIAADSGSDVWKDFSLLEGGPLRRLVTKLGLPQGRSGARWTGLALAVLTWLPLCVLAALDGQLTSGSTIPFLPSLGTHARLLVTVPMFFLAEPMFEMRVAQAIRLMASARLVAEPDLPRLDRALQQAGRWRDSWLVEAAAAVLAAFLVWSGIRTDLPTGLATWRATADGHLTAPGWWYGVVSIPLFQFLFWRWVARLLIWWWLLWRLSRLPLQLVATHADGAGGLGGLGVAQVTLTPIVFGCSAMLVATFVEVLLYGGVTLQGVMLQLAAIVVGSIVVMWVPLLVFMPRLFELRQQGLLEYGALSERYARAFDVKWLRGGAPPDEPLLGSADIQSLADLANAFGVIRNMRLTPLSLSQALVFAAAAALPMVPLILFVVPLDELIVRGVKGILGV
jgi:hypothetical protein